MYTHDMPIKPKLIRRNIAMWTDDYADMKTYADKHRVSVATIVRLAVRDYIATNEAQPRGKA